MIADILQWLDLHLHRERKNRGTMLTELILNLAFEAMQTIGTIIVLLTQVSDLGCNCVLGIKELFYLYRSDEKLTVTVGAGLAPARFAVT